MTAFSQHELYELKPRGLDRLRRFFMVTRCVCFDVSFQQINKMIREGQSKENVLKKTQAGQCCGCCLPYIDIAIKTGKDEIEVIKRKS